MENATIEKLSNAVSQLMTAYEKLQKENTDLKTNIKIIESQKNDLENNIANLSTTKEEQSTQMNSMLNKIESMLTISNTKVTAPSLDFNADTATEQKAIPRNEARSKESFQNNTTRQVPQQSQPVSNSTKIDLGRMESLLNGI